MASQLPDVRYDLINLEGGLDQVTPTLSLRPGVARRAANFECSITGGYTRIAGYERFDGRAAPSSATYTLITLTAIGNVAVGDTVSVGPGEPHGVVIAIDDKTLVLTRVSGTFQIGDLASVGGQFSFITDVSQITDDGLTDATYRALAADEYRSSITQVPGSGPVRGVACYKGKVYAWRNTAGAGSALAMYMSTPTGWSVVPQTSGMEFSGGSAEIAVGDAISGQTSGATAIVVAVVVTGGSWGGSPAASGRIYVNTLTGNFTAGESIRRSGSTVATATGPAATVSMLPGGRVQAIIANFGGGQDNQKMYFCDGVNPAFEFDGTTPIPIITGMSPNAPTCIQAHKQHLFLAFGHSLQFSSLGNPHIWSPVMGAGEIAMNSDITNLIVLPGDQSSGALGLYTDTDTSILYGSSEADFRLSSFNTSAGAARYTAQNMDQTYAFNERGVMAMGTTLNFGNFLAASLTMNIRPFVQSRLNMATASMINREKGQYRVFFNDGTGLYLTIANGKFIGAMPVQFPVSVNCCAEGRSSSGREVSYFGGSDGYVYALDAGTSFDGEPIQANITLTFNSTRSPRVLKRYRRASVEMTGDAYCEFTFNYDLGYRTIELDQPVDIDYANDLRSGYWDSFSWDNFVWDGRDTSPTEIEVTGTAENMAVRISSTSALFKPFTLNSIIVHYTLRRGIR